MADPKKAPAPSTNTLQRAVLWLAKQPETRDMDCALHLAAMLFGKSSGDILARVQATRELLK